MFGLIFGLFTLPILMAETAVVQGHSFTPWVLVNIIVYPLLLLPGIAVHEIGHAVAGRVLGFRVLRIEIGIGRRVTKMRYGALRLQLNSIPRAGATLLSSERGQGLRWRLWLTVLAGPMTTLAILLVVVVVCDLRVRDILWPSAAVAAAPAVAQLLAFESFWMLILNLLPVRLITPNSDGRQLLHIPFAGDRELAIFRTIPLHLEALECMEEDDFAGAQRALDAADAIQPGSWLVRHDVAVLHINSGRLTEARALLTELIAQEVPQPQAKLLAQNNLAWTDFMLGESELLAEADELSAMVHRQWKRAAFAMGTRGAVLGWLGRHSEAIAVLEKAFACNSSPTGRALNACCLALSYSGAGLQQEAERWLQRARDNHARCPLLERAAAGLASARSADAPG